MLGSYAVFSSKRGDLCLTLLAIGSCFPPQAQELAAQRFTSARGCFLQIVGGKGGLLLELFGGSHDRQLSRLQTKHRLPSEYMSPKLNKRTVVSTHCDQLTFLDKLPSNQTQPHECHLPGQRNDQSVLCGSSVGREWHQGIFETSKTCHATRRTRAHPQGKV